MYYPRSRIIDNRTALPGELVYLSGKEFSGKYWMTYDGRYFEGDFPNNSPTELYKSSETSNFKENTNIIKNSTNDKLITINSNLSLVNLQDPTPYYPKPTVEDYNSGNIIRYFTKERKIRTYKLFEIDKNTFDDIYNREGIYNYPMWDITSIFWKISGPLYNTYNGNIVTRAGVVDTNERLVELKNKEFIGINKYLTNFKEFYKE